MLKVTPTNLWEDTDVEALCLTSLEVSIEEGAETPPVRIQEEVIKTIKYPAADLFIDALPGNWILLPFKNLDLLIPARRCCRYSRFM
jgi:hypothetical protein